MRHQSSWAPRLADGTESPAERLAEALGSDILSGRLDVDARLPAHRDLAWRLGVGVGSVTRAYAMLERRGLVRSIHGRGMFVAARPEDSGTRFDLATNMPPPMFSDKALSRTLSRLARQVDASLFNVYPPVAGHPEHRRIMAHWLATLGIDVAPGRLLLTAGAQQALTVALTVTLPHVAYAVTEEQTYPGMLGAMRQMRLPVHGVGMDEEGMNPAGLEETLHRHRSGRAVVYLTPTMQNPTTATMGARRRQDIVSVCRKFEAVIIEDAVYVSGADGERPSIMELAPERTFLVGSLSKVLSPGLRIGALVPPRPHAEASLSALLTSSLMIAPLSYAMMAQWMQDGTAESVRRSLRVEAVRRHDLVAAHLGVAASGAPDPAFHAWLPMPIDQAARLVECARTLGVSLPVERAFQSGETVRQSGIRLALGNVTFRALPEALGRVRQARALVGEKAPRETQPLY
jgi:DNA-binding transcriptional MocR family regulator